MKNTIIQNYVLIVAAGKGSRMESNLPKQFLVLQDKPVLMHTIAQFHHSKTKPKIIIVIHPEMESYWNSLCKAYAFDIPHTLTFGGQTRFQSVKNGLSFIKSQQAFVQDVFIAIHDAARPLIAKETIDEAFDKVKLNKAVIVARQSTDSVRLAENEHTQAIDRNLVWLVQTPQVFDAQLLDLAYQQEERSSFTDDASVVEKLGNQIDIVAGHYTNIKITYPEDLQIAQLYLNQIKL